MTDNTRLPVPTSEGDLIAADDVSGVKFQRVKLTLGDDGADDGNISATNPVPVAGVVTADTGLDQPLTDAQLRAASLPLPMGAATDAVLDQLRILNDTMLYFASAMLEKLPRVTGSDQVAVSIEAGSVGLTTNQTLATVTTLGAINTIGGKHASGDNLNLAGVQHIYNNIVVS